MMVDEKMEPQTGKFLVLRQSSLQLLRRCRLVLKALHSFTLSLHAAKGMLMGKADALNSSFHLGYNMLLNLLRVEGVDPEYLIKKSFHQFQSDK